ncbi:hypothetical protein NLI96_g4531 [Meripilus lineatus]|uniref:Uncharacterized protein n=1 Tax=Meripilus lineatus TaxID=2056292 RepID=A0AAD5YFL9_9APHY|nr:hypothetical protein NLI96_g4531 [Physisporinus lineatus]
MSVLSPGEIPDTTENWDDDFEFQPHNNNESHDKTHLPSRRATTSPFNEDWDDEHATATSPSPPPLTRDKKNLIAKHPSLQHWAEPGPSTPTRKSTSHTENWDDDFQEKSDSPLRPHDSSPRSRRARTRPALIPEHENWDEEFESSPHVASPSGKSARWESSSSDDDDFALGEKEEDRTVTSRSRRSPISPHDPLNVSPRLPPPLPPVPSPLHLGPPQDTAPFPRSPTASVFSVPLSSAGGRESVAYSYTSTAPLALRPTVSGSSFGALPPSPPIHRERRRLRKKSRPPRVDDNIYELEDRIPDPPAPLNPRPCTPDRSISPPPAASDTSLPRDPVPPPSVGRNSLVSRIGSVGKKWGAVRKKRASTGPADVVLHENQQAIHNTPRPPSSSGKSAAAISPQSTPSHSRTGWFFRHGGGAGSGSSSPPSHTLTLKHEASVDKLLVMGGVDPDSPSRKKQKRHDNRGDLPTSRTLGDGLDGKNEGPPAVSRGLLFGAPRRPTSMAISSSSSSKLRARTPRHASYGQQRSHTPSSRSSSKARSVSASAEDTDSHDGHTRRGRSRRDESKERPDLPTDHHGYRGFMGGVRRISLGNKNKRDVSNTRVSSEHDHHHERQSTSTSHTAVPPRLIPDRSDDATPRPHSRITRPSIDVGAHEDDDSLLPPIELQPPSPPRQRAPAALAASFSAPTPIDSLLSPRSSADVLLSSSSSSPVVSHRPKPPLSISPQHSASLGRSTLPPKKDDIVSSGIVPRRNSLGDLKIPARISQAQVGLKRDLTMVRDFATSVEQLKELQATYNSLINDVHAILLTTAPSESTRATSPTLFNIPRPSSRSRSHTNPRAGSSMYAMNDATNHRQLTAAFHAIESKYRISWECAELLIELGGGPPATQNPTSPPPSAASTLVSGKHLCDVLPRWLAHPLHNGVLLQEEDTDLSSRQLLLLREILNNPHDVSLPHYGHGSSGFEYSIPEEEVNRGWRWGDAMTSTITLYSEESSQRESANGSAGGLSQPGRSSPIKKRRSMRLGMRGLRDMLKSLKKSVTEHSPHHNSHGHSPHHDHYHNHPNFELPPIARTPEPGGTIGQSAVSMATSTDSSINLPRSTITQTRQRKTSTGPESSKSFRDRHPNSPYGTVPALTHKSPRRPSLASIFRLGHKTKSSSITNSSPRGSGRDLDMSQEHVPLPNTGSANTMEEDDWHQISSASELELASKACGLHLPEGSSSTVRGKKNRSPYSLHQLQGERIRGIPETPRRTPNASQSSISGSGDSPHIPPLSSLPPPPTPQTPSSASYSRPTKLSNVRELAEVDDERDHFVHERQPRRVSSSRGKPRPLTGAPSPSPKRPSSRSSRRGQAGSVRSTPPQAWVSQGHNNSPELQASVLPPPPPPAPSSLALAMTPENLKPLLENAKEVHSRCNECISELRSLLQARRMAD